MTESTEIVVTSSPLALVNDWSLEDAKRDFAPVKEWRYAFQQKGATIQGLSADGVQDGVRGMALKGEAIRTLDVRLEKDTEHDAFFIAHACRYAISRDGQEILLDSTVRAKRVSKDGNPFWFEHGVTKAARNAEEALMPEALKQWMLAQSAGLEKPERSYRDARGALKPPPVRPDNDCEHEATVSDDGRTVCKKCGFLL